jgi:hypothetical protein
LVGLDSSQNLWKVGLLSFGSARAEGSIGCCRVCVRAVCDLVQGSELCGVRTDCVVRHCCMYCAGCATTWRVSKRRLAQLIAVPPFLRVYRVPAAGPAARAELIVDAPPRFAAVGAFLA